MRWLLTAGAALCAVSLAALPKASSANGARTLDSGAANLTSWESEAPPVDLRIGDVHFDVKLEVFADTYAGMTHFDTRVVQIDPSSIAAQRRRVYLHELMHVAWHEGKASKDKARKYTEEEAIQALTPGLLKLLVENPQAVEYLRK